MPETATRERPIIFSGPMVRAILEGRKSQTRRIVKFNHKPWLNPMAHVEYARDGMPIWFDAPPSKSIRDSDYFDEGYPCPYGQPGDRLWVRETWQHDSPDSMTDPVYQTTACCFYRADESDPRTKPISGKWRPSIHMPRWASRITLELTDVRVERLKDISEADATAEGVPSSLMASTHRIGFFNLWNSIHGCNADDLNPWVWVLAFRPISPSGACQRL
jgi:hypothetical protein